MAFINLMEYEWSGNPHEVDYYLPDSWDVTVYHIAGYQKPVLTPEQIAAGIGSPIGTSRISDLARCKNKVCILFDDLMRGTPTYKVLPAILAELKMGGIQDDQIEFICALGAHQGHDRSALVRKIGADIVEKYPVYNHVPFMNCTSLGKTSFGTKVEVSTEVMSCDLKISIQNIVPHPSFGFAGGGKIVMPGCSSYDSIADHHGVTHREFRKALRKSPDAKGVFDGNPQPQDAMECAKMAKIDFSINCMLNEKADIVAIFAGDIEKAYAPAIAAAKEHYRVPNTCDNDIAIANAYCKAGEAIIATASSFIAVRRTGGSAVTIANSPLGQVVHYLSGSWGMNIGGRDWSKRSIPAWINHCIFYSEFPEGRNRALWADKDLNKVLLPNNWTEVVSKLIEWHGLKAKVAVFPDGTNQYTQLPEQE
jgi:nickel-dependent lactate racemase